MIERCIKIIREGGELDFNQAMELAQKASLADLCDAAVELCHDVHGNSFDLCSIINARSGKCSEDCRYCAQSIHHTTNIKSYDQIDSRTAIAQARENDAYGVNRLSLVTAGRSLNPSQIEGMGSLYDAMAEKTTLRFCASMGFLTKESARQLVSFGVGRYHCNLESCRDFFPSICTTHTWEEKVETLKIARDAGMDLCSGGIIGMGETLEHRLQLAFELNGIYHYEPIHDDDKLASVQNNDQRKFQACIEAGIELCIIDVSSFGYFKPKRAQKFLDIITTIIDSRLSDS